MTTRSSCERYPDIEAEDAWVEWRRVRGELGQTGDGGAADSAAKK